MKKVRDQGTTRLSRDLLLKQGSLVRVVGFEPVFTGTATVDVSSDRRELRRPELCCECEDNVSTVRAAIRHAYELGRLDHATSRYLVILGPDGQDEEADPGAERPIPWELRDRVNFSFDELQAEIDELVKPGSTSKEPHTKPQPSGKKSGGK